VFLDDIDDFEEMNDTYSEFFDDEPPRSAVEVANLPKESVSRSKRSRRASELTAKDPLTEPRFRLEGLH